MMNLDNCFLDEFRNLNYELYCHVIESLNENDKWKNVISALSQFRIRLCFPSYKVRKMEMAPSPAEELFDELIKRACRVEHLKEILRSCNLADVLSLLSDPEKLEIIMQPGDDDQVMYICYNDELNLECQAIGLPPPKYQWFVNNVPLEDQNSSTLRLPNFSLENEGDYYCVVSQIIGGKFYEVESHTITVNLMDVLPAFNQQPPLKIVKKCGADLELGVEVFCHSRYSLQWMFNNSILPGETNSTLTLKNLRRNNSGRYRCMASNNAGEVYTIPTDLTVEGETFRPTAKVALLIANEKYQHFEDFSTPVNDVILLNEKLTKLKFKVITLINLDRTEMENTIKWFFQLTPPGAYAIICFVGHGFMLSNCRYMMPIDCPVEYRVQDCICDDLLVKNAKENKLKFLLLMMDMCLAVPNSEDNPQIFHERAPDYVCTFNGECHVIRTFSTTNHQKSYEDPKRVNGFYIEHVSKYLTINKPIRENLIAAHNDFEQKKFIKLQKPCIMFDGGYNIKLTDQAVENDEFVAKFESVNRLCHIHELNFSQIGLKTNLYVVPHRRKILNALDLHFLPVLSPWGISLHVSPPKGFELRGQHNEDGGFILTLLNLQKANSDIFLTILLRNQEGSSNQNTVANATVDLGMPLFTMAKVWCDKFSIEDSS